MADIEFAQYDPTEDYTDSEGSGDGEMTFPHPFGKQKDQLPWGENIKMERAKPLVELEMVRLSATLRTKPSWWSKFRDPEIRARWKGEALAQAQLMGDQHVEYVLNELEGYAALRDEASGAEVGCYDRIWHSDTLIHEDLRAELIASVRPLEEVPGAEQDWHPRSKKQVLDLIHPSLYPVVYGRTLQVQDLGSSREHTAVIEAPEEVELDNPLGDSDDEESDDSEYESDDDMGSDPALSRRFMWLPTDVAISSDGRTAHTLGYINNLHPITHAVLHQTIEKIIASYVPIFERVLTDLLPANVSSVIPARVHNGYSYDETYAPQPASDGFEDPEAYNNALEEWAAARPIILPDVRQGGYESGSLEKRVEGFSLGGRTVQFIVKLANIHLTPEKPTYPGGSWHVEGMKNEAIVASGIYYYDEDNITESRLAFRMAAAIPNTYEQYDARGCRLTWGIGRDDACNQVLGSVVTSKGRALAFPNIYQHQVSPFQLANSTRPGYRKILALFLVDPVLSSRSPLPSTTTVLPQQAHWRNDPASRSEQSPNMLKRAAGVVEGSMSQTEAKRIRLKLMDERTTFVADNDARHFSVPFSMCEH